MAEAATATNADGKLAVEIVNMHKWYGEFHVLRDINLAVERRERIVICGPSGSGKSTMIRCINRLEEHQQGRIVVDGTELTGDLKKIDEVRREVGMCFQHFNLFPHLTIMENCTLAPIWVRKMPKKDAEEVAMHQPARGASAGPHRGGRHRIDRRPEEDRRGAPRGRHVFPALQSVPTPHHHGELHLGADLGAQDAEEGRRGGRDASTGSRSISRAASWWTAPN